jgi:hypothetical protein
MLSHLSLSHLPWCFIKKQLLSEKIARGGHINYEPKSNSTTLCSWIGPGFHVQQWKSKQECYRCSTWAGYPTGVFPKTLNPKPDPTFWMVVYSGNGFYIITSASFTSQAICYNHCLLSEKVRAKSYDYGVQVHSWQEDWHGTAPKRIENANILGANTAIETDKVEDLWCPVCMWMQCQK